MPPDSSGPRPPAPVSGEIYLEIVRQGNAIVATAIDSVTGREASATGPLNARHDVERLAVGKLRRLLGIGAEDASPETKTPPGKGRGIIV